MLEKLPLETTSVVVDLGAGTGYFTLPMAQSLVDGGRVLATETNPNLPTNATDLVLMVDAYHEFSYPREVMEHVVASLRNGGEVILIEYRGEDPRVPIKRLHKMTEAQTIKEMTAVGLDWVETLDFLPQQHYLVFRKPGQMSQASSH